MINSEIRLSKDNRARTLKSTTSLDLEMCCQPKVNCLPVLSNETELVVVYQAVGGHCNLLLERPAMVDNIK